ncbi:MAG: arylamine N-acetyltransferase [Vulcanimicrobiota bacterium]
MKEYLERLGLTRVPDLPELMQAHLHNIPFENLSVLAGRPIPLDLESLERKLLLEKQGGYCFEHNTLFEHVLRQLGYQVTPLQARVRRGVHEIRPHTHKLLRVVWKGQEHLVDVGFGGEGISQPLPWVTHQEHEFYPGVFHRLVWQDELWVLQCRHDQGDWLDLYATENRRTYPVDDEMGNWYTSTFPGSLFRKSMLISLHHTSGYTSLFDGLLKHRRDGHTQTRQLAPEEIPRVLAENFGLRDNQ